MASQQQYKIDLLLDAQQGRNFSSTFTRAQQEFARLGKEIQSLNKTQSDISAYQKQQQAVQNTSTKLENLRGQMEKLKQQEGFLQKQIEEAQKAGQSTDALNSQLSSLEREELKLQQRIDSTRTALEQQNQRLSDTGTRLQAAGVSTANLASESERLRARTEQLRQEQERAAQGADTFGQSLDSVLSAVTALGAAKGLESLYQGLKVCVESASSLEYSMSTVEALSGAAADEMEALTSKAKALGAATQYTATQAADAMGYMAMAGWDAQEMLSGMSGMVNLTAAAGEDLAQVADIVTDNLTAFGLKASDTTHFADVLAAAATNSNTSVGIMGETFKQSASIAGALGYSIEDVAAAVGLMANSGIKGSIAGTALKNVFNGLLEGTTLTSSAFGDYEVTAIQAGGTMKSLSQTIDELREKFALMTEAERVMNAKELAGLRGYNGLLAILNSTQEDYDSLTNSIENCAGAAERMAKIRLDNLKGDVTIMDSAFDALKTTIGEMFIPHLRTLTQGATDVLGVLNQMAAQHPALIKGVTAFAGTLGVAATALTGYAAAAQVVKTLNLASLFAGPAGLIVLAGSAAAALAALALTVQDNVTSVRDFNEAARDWRDTMQSAADACANTADSTLAAASVADQYITKLEQMGDYARLSAQEQEQYRNTLSLLCELVPDLSDRIDVQNGRIEGGTDALRANTEAWKQNAIAQAYQDQLSAMYAAQADVLVEAQANSIRLTRAQYELDAAQKKRADTQKRLMELENRRIELENKVFRNTDSFTEESAELTNQLEALRLEYRKLEQSLPRTEEEILQAENTISALTGAIEDDKEAVAQAEEQIRTYEEAARSLTSAVPEIGSAFENTIPAMSRAGDALSILQSRYTELYGAALESVNGQYKLWDEAAPAVATSIGKINQALTSQKDYWVDYNKNMDYLLQHAGEVDGLSEVVAGFADNSKESAGAVKAFADALKSGNFKELQGLIELWQQTQEEEDKAAQNLAALQDDLPAQLDEIGTTMLNGVKDMDMSVEAAVSARNTILAFLKEADRMQGPVGDAYRRLALRAVQELGLNLSVAASSVPSASVAVSYAEKTVRSDSVMERVNRNLPTERVRSSAVDRALSGAYASGTRNAAAGWGLVGEEGPEIVRFRGGEQVIPAAETAAALSMGGSPNSIQVVFQISGNATPETVEALRDYGEEFAEHVLEVFENAHMDALRRSTR